nr:polysaccharide deacetylase family protein [uncultured Carboxylicivirga sp.]
MKTIHSGKVYKWLGVIFFTSLFFIGSLQAWHLAISKVIQNNKWSVKALVYHRFGDDRYPSTNTSVEDFEAQIKWLRENGYISVKASEVYALNDKDVKKYVCITVDDGYKSFLQNGLPILKKYGMKSTIYVNTESVGWGDYLSWDELKSIQKEGVEIGNHSHSHAYFLNKDAEERSIYFESDLDLAEKLFKKNLGSIPKSYAYPFGEFDEGMMSVLKNNGYRLSFAQNSGVWCETNDPYAIPRFPMSGKISIDKFISKVKMEPFRVLTEKKSPFIEGHGKSINVSFNYNQSNYVGGINCFKNGINYNDVQTYEDIYMVKLNLSDKKRRTLVTLTIKDKEGNWCWYSHLFIIPQIVE